MSEICLPVEYPYLYETHMHTISGSACAGCSGVEMARAYKEAGYTGIIITEHNWGGNTAVSRRLPWRKWVEEFSRGYEEAAEWGQRNGLSVFWGYEAGYNGTEFLIYGLSPSFLKEHPELKNASVEEQYVIVKDAGGMVVHAHPFREAYYIPQVRFFEGHVDAIEGINATHCNRFSKKKHFLYQSNHESFNLKAIAYAREQGLPMTAGSDMHGSRLFGGGMAFAEKLADIEDFCHKVLWGEEYLLTDGITWYTARGEPMGQVRWDIF